MDSVLPTACHDHGALGAFEMVHGLLDESGVRGSARTYVARSDRGADKLPGNNIGRRNIDG